jgi:phytoene dehydrogenase-like protein
MSKADAIIIGAGHNGLTSACFLARKGMSVAVLERRPIVGGIAAGEEFHPGYKTTGLLTDTSYVRPDIVETLGLSKYGLEMTLSRPDVYLAGANGDGVMLWGEGEKAAAEIASFSKEDAVGYSAYQGFISLARKRINSLVYEKAPDVLDPGAKDLMQLGRTAASIRLMGKKGMMELLKVIPMCAADWIGEYLKAPFLSAGVAIPGLTGTYAGPWSPFSAATVLMHEAISGQSVKGGPQALITALQKAAAELSVEIKTDAEVTQIRIENEKVVGVRLANGEEVDSNMVAASCSPKHTFLNLIKSRDLSFRIEEHARHFRTRGTAAKVNLALSAPLEFDSNAKGYPIENARTAESFDHVEKAFDNVKYGEFSKRPALDIHIPTVISPELAPDGHHICEILVNYAPYHLKGGWTDVQREDLGQTVIGMLDEYCPGVRDKVIHAEVITPKDMEDRYGLTEGCIHHLEHSVDQLITRPAPDMTQYVTPIEGLYLCGSGSHPGGNITCAPGALAANRMLKQR